MPAGRPSKYDPAICESVMECGRTGMGRAEIAAELGIDRGTLNEWAAKHEEFSRAVNAALDLSQAWWESQGRIATFGGCDGYNATSYIFQMKNRFRDDWSDTHKQEHSGNLAVTGVQWTVVDPKAASQEE